MGKVSVETGTFQDSICEGAVDNHRFKIAFGKVCSWNHRFKIAFGKVCSWNHRFKIAFGKVCSWNHRFKIAVGKICSCNHRFKIAFGKVCSWNHRFKIAFGKVCSWNHPFQESFWEGCHLKSGMKNPYPVDPKHLKSYFWVLFLWGVVVLTVTAPGVGPSNMIYHRYTTYIYIYCQLGDYVVPIPPIKGSWELRYIYLTSRHLGRWSFPQVGYMLRYETL